MLNTEERDVGSVVVHPITIDMMALNTTTTTVRHPADLTGPSWIEIQGSSPTSLIRLRYDPHHETVTRVTPRDSGANALNAAGCKSITRALLQRHQSTRRTRMHREAQTVT